MTVDPEQETPHLDEDGDPYEPYTAEELAIMWQTHHPQAEDGDSWFTGRWLATVKELQGALEFYADEQNWRLLLMTHPAKHAILEDSGRVARKALGKEPKEGTK